MRVLRVGPPRCSMRGCQGAWASLRQLTRRERRQQASLATKLALGWVAQLADGGDRGVLVAFAKKLIARKDWMSEGVEVRVPAASWQPWLPWLL